MIVPFVDLKKEYLEIKNEIDASVNNVLRKGNFVLGKEVEAFESEWGKYLNVKHAVGVANGTDAIYLALKALGITVGDEVIVPSFTFIATAFAVTNVGATPVFADIDPLTLNIDPTSVKNKITNRTKAIIPVHLYGNPADIDQILKIAKENKLYVIEDAAQAHGAEYKGRRVGGLGDVGCFSFYPTKNLGCYGDGGAIVTNNSAIAEKVKMIRNEGQKQKYKSEVVGTNSRLDEIQAAVLRVKLKYLDKWNEKRRANALEYEKLFENTKVQFQVETNESCSVRHVFPILVKKRDNLLNFLSKKNISSLVHYPIPAHLQKPYRSHLRLPICEKIARSEISLPMSPFLTRDEVNYTVEAIKSFYDR